MPFKWKFSNDNAILYMWCGNSVKNKSRLQFWHIATNAVVAYTHYTDSNSIFIISDDDHFIYFIVYTDITTMLIVDIVSNKS